MNLVKEKNANEKDITIIIKKSKKNKTQEKIIEEKPKKKENKNNNSNNRKPKIKQGRFQKVVFPISQITGKIKLSEKSNYNLYNISTEDINFLIKLILKESHNFSPVNSKFKKNLFFILLFLISFFLCIFYFYKKKTFLGIIFILIFLLFGFIYLHSVRKTINNNYKKLQQKLFILTDYINRKLLSKLGYYLLIDSSFRFIGIYIIPGSVRSILNLRDHNIEIKKKLEGGTIDTLKKKENYEEHPKYDDFMNNMLLKDIKDFTERNSNKKNIFNGNQYMNNRTLKNGKIKFNNFFKGKNNNDLIEQNDTADTGLTNKEKIRLEYARKIKYEKKKSDSFDESDNYPEYYYVNNNEENNSKINNRSIDKFKFYFGNSYNGIDLITN